MSTFVTPVLSKLEQQVGFGDPKVEINALDRYKGRKGVIDRISLVGKQLMRGNSHFFNQKKFRCLTEQVDKPAVCCERLGGPTQYFVVPVFQYVCDPQGQIINSDKCQGQLKMWLISESKYKELSGLHKQWPLLDSGWGAAQHDIMVNTTDETFQRMSFVPCQMAQWKLKETWYKTISQRALNAKDRLASTLGRRLNEQEVKELLGIVPLASAASMPVATDIDLAGVVGQVQTPVIVPIPQPTSVPAISIPTPTSVPTQLPAGSVADQDIPDILS